jgi:hypothetical protein
MNPTKALLVLMAFAASACDPFAEPDNSKPTILRVMAQDPDKVHVPVESGDLPGTTVVLQDVPVHHSIVRIFFNKVMDGSTIQANASAEFCAPAQNIVVTAVDGGGTPVPAYFAEVCWDPSGPSIVVKAASQTCAGLEPTKELLDYGYTYTIVGTGVRDHSGNTIDFNVQVKPTTALTVKGEIAGADGEPVDLATSPTGIPQGILEGGATIATEATYAPEGGAPAYGTPIELSFNAPMSLSATCNSGGVSLTVGGTPIDCEVVSGSDLDIEDSSLVVIYPTYPLEAGQTYSLTLTGLTPTAGAHGSLPTPVSYSASFTVGGSGTDLVWSHPPDQSQDSLASVDPEHWLHADSRGFGLAFSGPINTTGTVTVEKADGSGQICTGTPGAGNTPFADARSRSIQLCPNADNDVLLAHDTDYRIVMTGLQSAAAAPIPDRTITFRTAPFSMKAGSVSLDSELRPSGGQIPVAFLVDDTGAGVATTASYMAGLNGKVADTNTVTATAVPGVGNYEGLASGTVTLLEGSTPVAGGGGALQLTAGGTDPWNNTTLQFPGSIVGFTPTTPLKFLTQYTLAIQGVPGLADVNLAFSTTEFRVQRFRTAAGGSVGSRHVVFSATDPITFITSGFIDPAPFADPAVGNTVVQLFELSGGVKTQIPLTFAAYGISGGQAMGLTVTPTQPIKPATQYSLIVTSNLMDANHGTAIRAGKVEFISADPNPFDPAQCPAP